MMNDQRSCYTCGIPGHISRDCPTQGGVVSVNPNFVPFNGGFRGGGGGGGGGGYGGNRPRGVCYDWQKGECDRGNACRFAHSEDTQEFSNTNEGGGNPNFGRSRGVCFDWQKGACERGDNCRFTHSNENEGGTGSSYPTFSRPRFQGNGRQGQGNVRPGDWTCPACSVNNFASRINCFKCNTPKLDVVVGIPAMMEGGQIEGVVMDGSMQAPLDQEIQQGDQVY